MTSPTEPGLTSPDDFLPKRSGMIYVDRPGYYFGYGVEAQPEIVQALVGRMLNHEPATVVGKQLAIQELDQTPDKPVEALGGRSVQQELGNTWGPTFSAYTLVPGRFRGDAVKGTLYELPYKRDALALMDWNHAGSGYGDAAWRYWDHGLEQAGGDQAMTLSTSGQEVDRVVDGLNYPLILGNPEQFVQILEKYLSDRDKR